MADYLVCGPLDGPQIPGSLPERCSRCSAAVTVAPSGQGLRARRELEILCVPCAVAEHRRSGVLVEPLNAEQAAELAAQRRGG